MLKFMKKLFVLYGKYNYLLCLFWKIFRFVYDNLFI